MLLTIHSKHIHRWCILVFFITGLLLIQICPVRNKKIRCHATVSQAGNTFRRGMHGHEHTAEPCVRKRQRLQFRCFILSSILLKNEYVSDFDLTVCLDCCFLDSGEEDS